VRVFFYDLHSLNINGRGAGGAGEDTMGKYGFAALITAAMLLLVSCTPNGAASATPLPTATLQPVQSMAATPHIDDASTSAALSLAVHNAETNLGKQISPTLKRAEHQPERIAYDFRRRYVPDQRHA
jgi:hypothetical protein